jgi:uncharacterized protein YdbL (DUF1318 family)
MKTFNRLAFLVLALVAAPSIAVHAQDLSGYRQRMEERLPRIDQMKSDGVVGENSRGYLEARGTLSTVQNQVMQAENRDRSTVYGAIAAKTGASAGEVGSERAKKIAQTSKPGVWLQRDNGEWYRK